MNKGATESKACKPGEEWEDEQGNLWRVRPSGEGSDLIWKRPAHSGFEAPAIGTVRKPGETWTDIDGNVWRIPKSGKGRELVRKGKKK